MKKQYDLSTDVKKQHTVPRFLLDHFGHGKNKRKRRLFTYDKLNSKVYQQSVYDATTRNVFYNLKEHPEGASLEPILGRIETEAATAIKKIVTEKSLANLTYDEKEKIATFVVIQKSRTYHALKSIEFIMEAVADKVKAMGFDPSDVNELPKDADDLKNSFLHTILEHAKHAPLILNKSWLLYETTSKNPFYISDNPITLHNEIDMQPYGNIGLAVKGIQVHLPISSTLTLAFTCQSIKEEAIQARENFKLINKLTISQHFTSEQIENIFGLANAYENGNSFILNNENVRFLNGLQVAYAEQYVYNQINDFALVEEMVSDNTDFRHGKRMKVN